MTNKTPPSTTVATEGSYKYDVAFSFLSQDDALAAQINDLVQERGLSTFIFTERQREIAGKDGEEAFARVFGAEARVVVVLYRAVWGQTSWTRIEETAIRNRGYEHGYDFTVFIALEEHPTLPKWLPKNRLYVSLKRDGPIGAAVVIETRVRDQGGEPREETVQAQAVRLDRTRKFRQRREDFLQSKDAVAAASREYDRLEQYLQRLVADIRDSMPIQVNRYQEGLAVTGLSLSMSIVWRCSLSNSLDTSKLTVAIWNRLPPFYELNRYQFESPKRLRILEFDFDLVPSEAYVWREDKTKREFGTGALVEFVIKYYLDEDETARLKRSTKIDDVD